MDAYTEVLEKCKDALAAATCAENSRFLLVFPEDLGRGVRGRPASLWQCARTRDLIEKAGGTTAVAFSCDFGGDSAKPLRTATNLRGHGRDALRGWPEFDGEGVYTGPLPKVCSHGGHERLEGKRGEKHKTAASAVPPGWQKAFAELAAADLSTRGSFPSASKQEGMKKSASGTPNFNEKKRETEKEKGPEVERDEEATSSEDEDGVKRPKLGAGNWGTGPPLKVLVRGKVTHFRDGAGLCSPGRWLPKDRTLDRSATAQNIRLKILKIIHKYEDASPLSSVFLFSFLLGFPG